jgi:hypothetical protein
LICYILELYVCHAIHHKLYFFLNFIKIARKNQQLTCRIYTTF